MSDNLTDTLNGFVQSSSVAGAWEYCRRLMLHKQRATATDDPLLARGLEHLQRWAIEGDPLDRLVAIDLLVRVPASIRKIGKFAQSLRTEALRLPLPPLSIVADKRDLPSTAEPAEIRENVAKALDQADGDWVTPYAFRALAEEDRSQRCRVALSRQIARRVPNIDQWFTTLLEEPAILNLAQEGGLDNGASRLRDIALALGEIIRPQRYRLKVSKHCGQLLSEFARLLVPISPRQPLPHRLAEAASATALLLDELLAVRLTLMDEAEIYELLEPLKRWWSPAPYPKPLQDALTPIADKIIAGIIFRARGGQLSEALAQRLRQALNDDKAARSALSQLTKTEHGLSPDVQDWLLGIERKPASTALDSSRMLSAVGEEGFIRAIAPAIVLARETLESATILSKVSNRDFQLATLVITIGAQYGLEAVGKVGDQVEFSPTAHESIDGSTPLERRVELVRPIVVRRRNDGGNDLIAKGLVKSL